VRNLLGVVIGMVHVLLPYMVVALLPAMRAIDPRLLQAAHGLGAGRWAVIRRVLLPLSLGGVAAGCLLTFILGVAFFITPAILGAPSDVFVSQLVAREIERFQDIGLASAMGVVLTACVLPLYLLMVRILDPSRLMGGDSR
jgi:ABC-type spermidine/putrescine transport system permease subunit I